MPDLLEIDDVSAGYEKADVLHGVSLTVKAESITCLLGSNGAGKTTVVRAILGLTPARAGRILFDGIDITGLATHRIIAARCRLHPRGRKVFPKLTVEENLRAGAYREPSEAVVAGMADIFRIRRSPSAAITRRHHVGRRAGHGVDRARPDARAKLLLIDEPSLGLRRAWCGKISASSARSTSAASPSSLSNRTCARRSPSRPGATSSRKVASSPAALPPNWWSRKRYARRILAEAATQRYPLTIAIEAMHAAARASDNLQRRGRRRRLSDGSAV